MATVELSFTPLPAHVRTARLVATAVARRSRVEESLLDEVRLAVGEACSRAVEAHRLHCPAEHVRVELSDRDGRFEVVVIDSVPGDGYDGGPGRAHGEPVGQERHSAPADLASGSVPAVEETAPAGRAAGGQHGSAAGGSAPGQHGGAAGGEPGHPQAERTDPRPVGVAADSAANGSLPVDIGLAVIEGLADDVHVSATSRGVTIRMSWPIASST